MEILGKIHNSAKEVAFQQLILSILESMVKTFITQRQRLTP